MGRAIDHPPLSHHSAQVCSLTSIVDTYCSQRLASIMYNVFMDSNASVSFLSP